MRPDIKAWEGKANYFRFAGHQFAYWREGNGPVLLLVHGFPTSSWDWVPMWDCLTRHYTVVACDFLGFGLSDKPKGGFAGRGYRLVEQADALEALLTELGIGAFDALVHDYGVSVGQELLARQQEGSGAAGLGQMVFLNGGIFPGEHRPRLIQKIGASPIGVLVSLMINRQQFGRSFRPIFGPDTQPDDAELDAYWHFISHKQGHRRAHELLRYMHERVRNKARWVGALEKAQDKIGLIDGALDPISGEHVYRVWRERLPDARHHLLPRAAHYPQVEAPGEVAKVTLDWLANTTA